MRNGKTWASSLPRTESSGRLCDSASSTGAETLGVLWGRLRAMEHHKQILYQGGDGCLDLLVDISVERRAEIHGLQPDYISGKHIIS